MHGVHDPVLVAASVLVAMFASYTALSLARRIRTAGGWMRRFWIGAAAGTLGSGIWSMHFVAMLAFRMPGMEMSYSPGLTLLSLGLAVGFTAIGFAVLARPRLGGGWIGAAGLAMGLGVVAMHYVGMAAMQLAAPIGWRPGWVAASVVIAIIAATVSLVLASRDRDERARLAGAALMGTAIAGMHFAGMRAAVFHAGAMDQMTEGLPAAGQTYLAIAVGLLTVLILLLALAAGRLEDLFQAMARREARVALRLRIADVLREATHPEALSQVAALMGRHFAVSRAGYGQLDAATGRFHHEVCWTDGTVPTLTGSVPAAQFGSRIDAELRAGRTMAIDDLASAQFGNAPGLQAMAATTASRAVLIVPFLQEGQLASIVYLDDRRPRHWHRDEIAFLEELAERTRLVMERSAVDKQLRALNAELEARVEARTEELRQAQEALVQSQKMEAIGQLAAGMAHDFNNLLGSVVSALQLIGRRAEDPARVRSLVAAGIEAAERGSRLTGQLLSFSRHQPIRLEGIAVRAVIGGMAELLERTLGPMIALRLELADEADGVPICVRADATQFEMVLLNLAINARDAMPEGGRLTIGTRLCRIAGDAELADGEYVDLSVSDTGIGMDEETRRRAMDPFFSTKPVGKGTGLGLSQIYGSVRRAGGRVQIESAPGAGTTVHVLLAREAPAPVRGAGCEAAAGAALAPLRVLAVDDDDSFRRMLVLLLEENGHRVHAASGGREALDWLEATPPAAGPDLVLLDFAMPGMSGAEVAAAIRAERPALPIVFASGYADTDAIRAAVGSEATILRKPFREEELLAALRACVAGAGAGIGAG